MKRLEIEQPTIEHLFAGRNGIFSIPFYQRPYSWTEEQCAELWHDLNYFAFPNGHADEFNPDENGYFLGNMVTYPNEQRQIEVVDGQQRIISLLLLMRALYEDLRETENGRQLGKCIWYFAEDGIADMTRPRIISNSILDNGKNALKQILVSGTPVDQSNCAVNYRFFRAQIMEFKAKTPDNLEKLAARLLRNVYVTQMEADDETQALQLFLTINDRGMSLRISDIFQAKLYADAKSRGDEEANAFLEKWQSLDERCKKLFDADKNLSPLEFVFLLYAHTQRENASWKNLKEIYGANDYALLKCAQTLKDIESLLDFLATLHTTSKQLIVSDDIAQKAYILFRCNKVTAWYLMTAYYFKRRNSNGEIFDEQLDVFLERSIAYLIRSVAAFDNFKVTRPYALLDATSQLMNGDIPDDMKISEVDIRKNLSRFYDLKSYQRAQRVIVNWWTFKDKNQPRVPWKTKLHIEHIFAKALVAQHEFDNPNNVELPGNLALLEDASNRKATCRSFADKCKFYRQSKNLELRQLAEYKGDFTEADILNRNDRIIEAVIELLAKNNFLLR